MASLASPPIHPLVPLPVHPDEDGLYPRDKEYLKASKQKRDLYWEIVQESFIFIRSFPKADRGIVNTAFHTALNQIHPNNDGTQINVMKQPQENN
tara:strand:- start:789 stop:1073 length:285 start_codon:yes stop_codon:yes gene_type:complete